jgi:hypothetical protein
MAPVAVETVVNRSRFEERTRNVNFSRTHLWVYRPSKDRIYIRACNDQNAIHKHLWGDWVWDCDVRGYYDANNMVITCHYVSSDKLRVFEEKLQTAFKKKSLEIIYASWA